MCKSCFPGFPADFSVSGLAWGFLRILWSGRFHTVESNIPGLAWVFWRILWSGRFHTVESNVPGLAWVFDESCGADDSTMWNRMFLETWTRMSISTSLVELRIPQSHSVLNVFVNVFTPHYRVNYRISKKCSTINRLYLMLWNLLHQKSIKMVSCNYGCRKNANPVDIF